jgi:hypothetical protein
MMDVKTLSGVNELYYERGTARTAAPAQGASGGAGAAGVNGEYIAKARTLDHEHSRQADGTRYPGVREQVQGHLARRSARSVGAGWRRCGPGTRC